MAPLGRGGGPSGEGAGAGARGRREYTLVIARVGKPGGLEVAMAACGAGGVDVAACGAGDLGKVVPGVPGA